MLHLWKVNDYDQREVPSTTATPEVISPRNSPYFITYSYHDLEPLQLDRRMSQCIKYFLFCFDMCINEPNLVIVFDSFVGSNITIIT